MCPDRIVLWNNKQAVVSLFWAKISIQKRPAPSYLALRIKQANPVFVLPISGDLFPTSRSHVRARGNHCFVDISVSLVGSKMSHYTEISLLKGVETSSHISRGILP